eukprot:gene25814-31586_t
MADAAPPPDDVDDARNDHLPTVVVELDKFRDEISSKYNKCDFTLHVKPTSSAASPDDELRMAVFRCKAPDGTFAKTKLEKYADRHHHALCLAYDFDAYAKNGLENTGAKVWTSVRDHATFARMALLCDFEKKKINRWYEVLREEHRVRFVVDIDIDFAMNDEEKVALLRTYIHSAKIALKKKCATVKRSSILNDKNDTKFRELWRITDASKGKKTSFHLVLTGLGHLSNHLKEGKKLNGAIEKVFMASAEFIQFEKYCKRNSEGALQSFLDNNIYSSWRPMRLPLMVKAKLDPEKERTFYPVEVDFEKNTITRIPHKYEDGFADAFPDYMASFVTPDEMKVKLDLLTDQAPGLATSTARRSGKKRKGTASNTAGAPRKKSSSASEGVIAEKLRSGMEPIAKRVFELADENSALFPYKNLVVWSKLEYDQTHRNVLVRVDSQKCPFLPDPHSQMKQPVYVTFEETGDIFVQCWDKTSCKDKKPAAYPTAELKAEAMTLFKKVSFASILTTALQSAPAPSNTSRETPTSSRVDDDPTTMVTTVTTTTTTEDGDIATGATPEDWRDDETDAMEEGDENRDDSSLSPDDDAPRYENIIETAKVIDSLLAHTAPARDIWVAEIKPIIGAIAMIAAGMEGLFPRARELAQNTIGFGSFNALWAASRKKRPNLGVHYLRDVYIRCGEEAVKENRSDSSDYFAPLCGDTGEGQEVTQEIRDRDQNTRDQLEFHSTSMADKTPSSRIYKLSPEDVVGGVLKRKREDAPEQITDVLRFLNSEKRCPDSGEPLSFRVSQEGQFTVSCRHSDCGLCPKNLRSFNPGVINLIYAPQINITNNNYTSVESHVAKAHLLPDKILEDYNA